MTAVVGVNLLWLVPGVVGGSEEYTVRLLAAVARRPPGDLRLRLYARRELAAAHPGVLDGFETVTAPRTLGAKPARVAVEHTWLARVSRGDDLVHHAGGVVPVVRSTPTVLTVHDLQPFDLPDHFSPVKRRWLHLMVPRSVRAARLVLAPSRFTAARLVDRLRAEASRVRVVPHGHDRVEPGPPPPDVADRLARRYGRFILYPAIAYPHKRHLDLLDAFARLAAERPELSVVFTGGPAQESASIEDWCRSCGLGPRVHRLGRVPAGELDHLLRAAVAVAVPSEYEGFGNPALEAMARGTPVVVADAGSLPEVVADAAAIVPARDPAALAVALAGVLDDPARAADLAARGPRRAAHFDDGSAADALVDSYRVALDAAVGGFPRPGRASPP
jgi:glycosyltransferase involved in cell wall biosynthesis